MSEVVDCSFAVGGGDDIVWVEAKVDGYFPPGCLYGGDGVSQSTVLYKEKLDCVDKEHLGVDIPCRRGQHQQ